MVVRCTVTFNVIKLEKQTSRDLFVYSVKKKEEEDNSHAKNRVSFIGED
jgi:hypothetical protein